MSTLPKALHEMGGCTLIALAWAVFGVGYMIYWFVSGGNPEVVRFRNDCHDRRVSALGERHITDLPRQFQLDIVRLCEDALRRFLDSKRQ